MPNEDLRQKAEAALAEREGSDGWWPADVLQGPPSNGMDPAEAAFVEAASPQRILALLNEVGRLQDLLLECADDIEANVKHEYEGMLDYPTMKRRYDRDMDLVHRARAALPGRNHDE